jgi:hypothetical protein
MVELGMIELLDSVAEVSPVACCCLLPVAS